MINLKRLRKFRAFLRQLPPGACDMTYVLRRAQVPIQQDDKRWVTNEEMKEKGFECGTVGCIKGWVEVMADLETGKGQSAEQYLRLTSIEQDKLFYSFPNAVKGGWKKWMLHRIDNVLKSKKVTHPRDVKRIG